MRRLVGQAIKQGQVVPVGGVSVAGVQGLRPGQSPVDLGVVEVYAGLSQQ